MKTARIISNSVSSVRIQVFFVLLAIVPGLLIIPASGQNPWNVDSKPLIDDGNQNLSDQNTWREDNRSQLKDGIDTSKYPPLEEDKTLGTGIYGYTAEGLNSRGGLNTGTGDISRFYNPEALGEIPVYPGSNQPNIYGGYANRPVPTYNQGYQNGYLPGSSGLGGFPLGGSPNNTLPFGMGNTWMPFSNNGFW